MRQPQPFIMPPDIRKSLKRLAPKFNEARIADLNEADTVLRLCKFFEDVLGYDAIEDISREANMKNKFVDVCLKVDGTIKLLVEAKAASVKLRDRHIEQAHNYASRNNYRWVLLTNGVEWNLYHLTFEEGIEYERAFSVSLATPAEQDDAASKLAFLHKQALKRGELEKYWEKMTALGPASIGKSLFKEPVLRLLRREIRKDCGILIDQEDLGRSLHEMFTPEAREAIGPLRIRKSRAKSSPRKPADSPASHPTDAGSPAI